MIIKLEFENEKYEDYLALPIKWRITEEKIIAQVINPSQINFELK